jgi:predicted deacylase
MNTVILELMSDAPGTTQQLQLLRYGPERGPKATIQAALHADEIPAMLVAQVLRRRLAELEAAGRLLGPVQLLPYANPIGLTQHLLGAHEGRFDLRDGINFNRLLPDLAEAAALSVAGRLGADSQANCETIRAALREAAAAVPAAHAAQDLKKQLMQTAIDSDVVLDLHSDAEAAMHLYALTPQASLAAELGALLGAEAVLLATDSGDMPFDEACSRPWWVLQQRYAAAAVPLACFSVTVELRGQADTGHALAEHDAEAIIEFLRRRGIVAGTPAPLPTARCDPTPLAGSEPITAPRAGVVVFQRDIGDEVQAGDVIADLVDITSGEVLPLRCQSSGRLYARIATRWATPGKRLAKIAGTTLARSGKLLGP